MLLFLSSIVRQENNSRNIFFHLLRIDSFENVMDKQSTSNIRVFAIFQNNIKKNKNLGHTTWENFLKGQIYR